MADNWTNLEHKYSHIFERNKDYGHAIELITFHDGWFNIVQTLLEELSNIQGVKINLIKEKWGCLRIQTHTVQGDVARALCSFAEKLSEKTCSKCGKAGTIQNIGGYYIAICSDCIKNQNQPL